MGASKCAGMTRSKSQLITLFAQALDASGARERMIWIIGATSGAPSWEKRAKARGVSAWLVLGLGLGLGLGPGLGLGIGLG